MEISNLKFNPYRICGYLGSIFATPIPDLALWLSWLHFATPFADLARWLSWLQLQYCGGTLRRLMFLLTLRAWQLLAPDQEMFTRHAEKEAGHLHKSPCIHLKCSPDVC